MVADRRRLQLEGQVNRGQLNRLKRMILILVRDHVLRNIPVKVLRGAGIKGELARGGVRLVWRGLEDGVTIAF